LIGGEVVNNTRGNRMHRTRGLKDSEEFNGDDC